MREWPHSVSAVRREIFIAPGALQRIARENEAELLRSRGLTSESNLVL